MASVGAIIPGIWHHSPFRENLGCGLSEELACDQEPQVGNIFFLVAHLHLSVRKGHSPAMHAHMRPGQTQADRCEGADQAA